MTDNDLPDLLAACERADKAATPGPWHQGDTDAHPEGDSDCVYDADGNWIFKPCQKDADVAFAVLARNSLPTLVARVRELEGAEATLREIEQIIPRNEAHRDYAETVMLRLFCVDDADRHVISQLEARVRELEKFKAYVHQRLDDAGIDTHPDGSHSKEGCRVGDRLDEVLGRLRALAERMEKQL